MKLGDLKHNELVNIISALGQSAIVAVTDSNGIISYVNNNFCEVSKYSREELIGKTHKVINSGYHRPEFIKSMWETIRGGHSWRGEFKNKAKDGSTYWVDTTIVPILDVNELPREYVAIRYEITEKKAAETQLENALQHIKNQNFALNQAAMVAITDKQGLITFANEKFCEISEYSEKELIGRTHKIVNSGYHDNHFFKNLWLTITKGNVWRGEIKNRSKSGKEYWVETTIVPFLDEQGRPQSYTAIRKDISYKKEAQLQIEKERAKAIYAEKMASLGEMSAGIAHELGNPLGVIRGRLEMLLMYIDAQEINKTQLKEQSNKMIELIDRMTKIIKGIRSIARDGSNDPFIKTSLNTLIDNILSFSNEKFTKLGIKISAPSVGSDIFIECREAEIGQVIVNLISNACDAIKNLDQRWISIHLSENNKIAKIEIIDSGSGIPQNITNKIFETFYTTKEVGKGTGLGLSISRNIVSRHKGKLYIDDSSPNTKFVVELPKHPMTPPS